MWGVPVWQQPFINTAVKVMTMLAPLDSSASSRPPKRAWAATWRTAAGAHDDEQHAHMAQNMPHVVCNKHGHAE
jgi:hypothetical protein